MFLGILMAYQKRKCQNAINPIIENVNFNNNVQNKPLLNHLHIIILMFMLVALTCLFIGNNLIQSEGPFDGYLRTVYIELTTLYFLSEFLPIFVLLKKTTFRTFLWRELQAIFQSN